MSESAPDPAAPAPAPGDAPRREWVRVAARIAVALAGAVLLVVSLAAFAGSSAWWLDLPSHFRPQVAIALAAVALLQLSCRPRWLVSVWAAGAMTNGLMIAPHYVAQPAAGTGEALAIVHSNTGGDAVDTRRLAAWIAEAAPDLILLQEVTPRNLPRIIAELDGAGLKYELLASEPRNDTRGVGLLSRRGGVNAAIVRPAPDQDRPMVEAELELAGMKLALLGFHATRPAPKGPYGNQRAGMRGAATWSKARAAAGFDRLLIGDFNSTSQGALLGQLCREAELFDARRGHGWQGTWPADLPAILRVPIDGAYHSDGIAVQRLRVGPSVGGDHLPILLVIQRRAA